MKIQQTIKLARKNFSSLSCDSFENLLQCAQELKSFRLLTAANDQLLLQGQFELAELITKLVDLDDQYICNYNGNETSQSCFPTTMQLVNAAKQAFLQGKILICDDLQLWKYLQYSILDSAHIPYDFIEKLHLYFLKSSQISALNMLRHPFLKNFDGNLAEESLVYEYNVRKNPEKNSWKNYVFVNTLAKQLLESRSLQDLPALLTQSLLLEYVEFLDSLDWYRLAVSLKTFSPQIRLGLHHALQYRPDQVVFCLKYSQIRSLICQRIIKVNALEILLAKWKEGIELNVLAHSNNGLFEHPLLVKPISVSKLVQESASDNQLIVNPPLNSRPKVISATGFNHLMQDPYGFYARYILKLRPLECAGAIFSVKEFGINVHKLIEVYIKQGYQSALDHIKHLHLESPKLLWHGRLLRIIHWVDKQFRELKPIEAIAETNFEITLSNGIGIKARIDACLLTDHGNLVVNFKTGTPPSKMEVLTGYWPQLLIEIFLCQNVYASSQTQGEFWHLKGTQPSGIVVSNIVMPLDAIQKNLERVTNHYLQSHKPFLACPWPLKKPKYNEYLYLERINNERI